MPPGAHGSCPAPGDAQGGVQQTPLTPEPGMLRSRHSLTPASLQHCPSLEAHLCACLCPCVGHLPAWESRKQAENREVTLAVPCQPHGNSGKLGTALSQQLREPPAERGTKHVPYPGGSSRPEMGHSRRQHTAPARGRCSDLAQGSRALSHSCLLPPSSPIPALVPWSWAGGEAQCGGTALPAQPLPQGHL